MTRYLQVDAALQWFQQCQSIRNSDAVRIQMAMILPPVYNSLEDMQTRWKNMLSSLKKLLTRNLHLESDAYVCCCRNQ